MLCLLVTLCMLFSPTSARAMAFDAATLYDSVFVVYSGRYLGSGFSIGENCIITNAHVIADKNSVQIKTYTGELMDAAVAAYDEDQDIAVLYIPDAHFDYLTVANPGSVSVGDDIYTIGAPNNLEYTLTKGIISAVGRQISGHDYYQIDAAVDSGNSGGPLINDAGEVIGVNTLKEAVGGEFGFAVPMTAVCGCLENAGIALTGQGNVDGIIENMPDISGCENMPAETLPAEQANTTLIPKNGSSPSALWIGLSAASAAVLIIVILAVVRARNKKKADPRERTDFEIDFWE